MGILVSPWSLAAPPQLPAAVVFDDPFDGNSGGVPEGWSRFSEAGDGEIIESGGTVTMLDDCAMLTDQTVNPNAGDTATVSIEIAGTNERSECDLVDSADAHVRGPH